VRAGSTGAPAGFSLQWITKDLFDQLGGKWPSSDDPRVCSGSFSGNAQLSRYNLLPNEAVFVRVGEFLFDNGASTNCLDALLCNTVYVFRAFAHATSTLQRSDFTPNLLCSTTNQCASTNCVFTQGYWKTHGPGLCVTGQNTNQWPVEWLILGDRNYSASELCAVLQTPASGNGLVAMAHQLIAADLNIANGASADTIAATITDANNLVDSLVIPSVGTGFLPPSSTSADETLLERYNSGNNGPLHCV
jgi:hypothetical protein